MKILFYNHTAQVSGAERVLIAGPCSVESETMILDTAAAIAAAGGDMLRGGAYKPRTSPYAFQGLGDEALTILREASEETGLPVVTELMDPRHVEAVVEVATGILADSLALLADAGHMLGDAAMQIDIGRLLTMRAAWKLDRGEFARKEATPEAVMSCATGHARQAA